MAKVVSVVIATEQNLATPPLHKVLITGSGVVGSKGEGFRGLDAQALGFCKSDTGLVPRLLPVACEGAWLSGNEADVSWFLIMYHDV